MLKLPNSIEPAVMAENIVHLRDSESSLDGRVSDLEVTAPKDYSTTETATGQKWIDGKDIYQTVISSTFGEITAASNQEIATIGPISNVISADLFASTSDQNRFKLVNRLIFTLNTGVVVAESVIVGFSEKPYYLIVRYTKPGYAKGPEDSDQEPEESEEKKTTRKKAAR